MTVRKGELTEVSNFISMGRILHLAFVVAVIGGTMLSMKVDAQSTVDDSASCESSMFDEAVDLIKEEMNNVGLIREDLKAVNLIREDLEALKNVLESNQQRTMPRVSPRKSLQI